MSLNRHIVPTNVTFNLIFYVSEFYYGLLKAYYVKRTDPNWPKLTTIGHDIGQYGHASEVVKM